MEDFNSISKKVGAISKNEMYFEDPRLHNKNFSVENLKVDIEYIGNLIEIIQRGTTTYKEALALFTKYRNITEEEITANSEFLNIASKDSMIEELKFLLQSNQDTIERYASKAN